MVAATSGDLEMLGKLIERDRELLNRRFGPFQRTALMAAAEYGPVESIHFLIEHGADPSVTNNWGRAALHQAVAHSRPAHAEALVLAGADVNQMLITPDHPAMKAALEKYRDKLSALYQTHNLRPPADPPPAGRTPLDLAASMGVIDCVKVLLKHGAKIDGKPPERSESALFYAVTGDYISHDKFLRENIKVLKSFDGRSDQVAVSNGNREVIVELLVHGASLSDRNHLGDQPIHVCAKFGAVDTLTFLLENYADEIDVNAPGSFGQTPLQQVANGVISSVRQEGDVTAKVIRLLLDHGADPQLTTEKCRQTPYEIALKTQRGPRPVSETVLKLLRLPAAPLAPATDNGADAAPTIP